MKFVSFDGARIYVIKFFSCILTSSHEEYLEQQRSPWKWFGSDVQLPSVNSEWVQGRQFLTRGQACPWREVSTTFEIWFKGTRHVGKCMKAERREYCALIYCSEQCISVLRSKRFPMGRSDQILIHHFNDSSKFKVFERVSNLSSGAMVVRKIDIVQE